MTSYLPLLLALGLMLVHLFIGRLRFLDVVPRSRWLSLAGGVSIAYVFIHILPELSAFQEKLKLTDNLGTALLDRHVYLLALAGLVVFYGLERAALLSRLREQSAGRKDATSVSVFWLHIGSFAAYNALIGYLLLHREEPGTGSLLLFFFAMALHFVINDFGLRQHHQRYIRSYRPLDTDASYPRWLGGGLGNGN